MKNTKIKSLLRSQANSVFDEIIKQGLNPGEFQWVDVESPYNGDSVIVSKLEHQSEYYYIFDNDEGEFYSQWSPHDEVVKSDEYVEHKNWGEQFSSFQLWLEYLKREIESPDLWNAIAQESEIIDATTSGDSNTQFTKEEKAYIFSGIEEIKQYLLTAHKLDPELVESRLNYLAEASERVGRKDWINLLLSVLIGIVVAAALPPETTREIFRFVGQVLHNVLQRQLLLM
jgi:thioester reductase-like protein